MPFLRLYIDDELIYNVPLNFNNMITMMERELYVKRCVNFIKNKYKITLTSKRNWDIVMEIKNKVIQK